MKKLLLLTGLLISITSVQSQTCNGTIFTSGPNAFGVGGGITTYKQSCLTYNKDLNAVLWIQRASPRWGFSGYTSGCIQATWMNVASGVWDSTVLYYDSGFVMPARYPGGSFYNPVGNTNISNAYVVGSGPGVVSGPWGSWHSSRKLTGTSADQIIPVANLDWEWPNTGKWGGSGTFINNDMQQVGNKIFVGGEARDSSTSTSPTTNAIFGGIIGKCDFSSGNPVWSYDSIIPGYYFYRNGTGNGYSSDGEGGRIAFGPSGMIGYWVAQGRLATDFYNSADSMLAPVVYKTTNGGSTWFPVLQGFDWSAAHPELLKNVGYVYNAQGARHFKINGKLGCDLTVDSLGTLHFVTALTDVYRDGAEKDSLIFSYTYNYDYINRHPVIWDLMTDGTTWKTLMVDSILSATTGLDAASDTTSAASAWTDGSAGFLSSGTRIQVSRSVSGGKIFYSWADTDPSITGTPFNTAPDLYLKSYDISNQKVTVKTNVTNGIMSCYFHYASDISYYDNSAGKWICPLVYTTGTVFTAGQANGTSAVDYNYVNCGGFSNSGYVNPAVINSGNPTCTPPNVSFVMHKDSLNPQPGVWLVSTYYSPQVTSAVWNWGDGSSTIGFAPTHTYSAAGQYSICVTVYGSCGDSATNCQYDGLYKMAQNGNQNSMISVTVLDVNGTGSGINANAKEAEQISIYPNPGTGLFTLKLTGVSGEVTEARITVTNILGEHIYSAGEKVIGNSVSKEIDLQNLSNGAYFMKVNVGNKMYNDKLIINK